MMQFPDCPHPRRIKSFVRREGRMTDAQAHALSMFSDRYTLQINPLFDHSLTFGRTAPLVLEIGFGMGDALIESAVEHPDHDFIGIEVHRPGVGAVLTQLTTLDLKNVRLYSDDAIDVLKKAIPDHSIDLLRVFFPDPWPKRRHHKRRLINLGFLNLIHQKIKLGGYLHIATDWQPYYAVVEKLLNNHPRFVASALSNVLPRPQTKFEKRGIRHGHAIYDLVMRLV